MMKFDKIVKILDTKTPYENVYLSDTNISPIVNSVLRNRGIIEPEARQEFLNPTYNNFLNPFLLNDMDKAVERIIKGIAEKQKIFIYGDYDVDGVTSTSILKIFIDKLGGICDYYIPDRMNEGYGLNNDAIDSILKLGGELIITVDCGITSFETVEYCNSKGIEIIITDHHTCGDKLPNAYAVINPNRNDSIYPFKKLAGVGVALKVIQGVSFKLNMPIDYDELLPIAAIGTVADIVSLTGENRIIVKEGLKLLSNTRNIGIKALLDITGLSNNEINTGHIGFIIGPRINAAGRIGLAKIGVRLFITNDTYEANTLAKKMDEENVKRQEIENGILLDAERIIANGINLDENRILVLASNNWHTGVIGIVSSKITEKYYRPSILISIENGEGKGSARSIPTFNIYDGLNQCSDLFIKFGGHKQAAGLSIKEENIPLLRNKINTIANTIMSEEDFIPEILVDCELKTEDICIKTAKDLKILEPHGIDNSSPTFIYKGVIIKQLRRVGKDKRHLKCIVEKDGLNVDCIAFNCGEYTEHINEGDKVDLIASLGINNYLQDEKVQLNLKDILFYDTNKVIKSEYYSTVKGSLLAVSEYNKRLSSFNFSKYSDIERMFSAIKSLQDENRILLLVNNYFNFIELYDKLKYLGRDFLKENNISFATIDSSKKNCILVNPIYNGNLKCDYDKIILYDLPLNFQHYHYINHKFNELFTFTGIRKDIEANRRILDEIIPQLEEIRFVYKTFADKNIELLRLNFNEYNSFTLRRHLTEINQCKFEIILDILKDKSLLDYKKDNTDYYIKLNEKPSDKINIMDAKPLKYLLSLKETMYMFNFNIN